MLKFEGAHMLRARLVCSMLSNRPAVIHKIRELDDVPGLRDYEVSFAQLVDKLSNGTKIVINSTGTTLSIHPGYIIGGEVEHECEGRSMGYFLEAILPLCLFAKRPVRLVLTGITNDDVDISVDLFKNVTSKLISKFGVEQWPQVDIVQRGLPPHGKGKVIFTCPIARELRAAQIVDPGFVNKVRGVAYGVRVSPQILNRIATTSRGIFNTLLPDVYINTDHIKSKDLQEHSDPGYGIALFAESTTGCFLGTKRGAIRQSVLEQRAKQDEQKSGKENAEVEMLEEAHPGVQSVSEPETVGENASYQLLEEIARGGCVDTVHQPLVFLLMTLCPEDVSKVRVGKLSAYSVNVLRLIHEAFGVVFKLKEDGATVVCSCVGVGYKNLSRKVT